jgi:hypothetical protein
MKFQAALAVACFANSRKSDFRRPIVNGQILFFILFVFKLFTLRFELN